MRQSLDRATQQRCGGHHRQSCPAEPGVGAIAAYLQRAIGTGAYSEGDRLPPERQLAATFQAARSTVPRALDQLEKAGLVSRRSAVAHSSARRRPERGGRAILPTR